MNKNIFLPPDKAEVIHRATLKVLSQTGVNIQHDEGKAMLLEHGAKEDADGRVLIKPKMVSEALEKISPHSTITMYDRRGEKAFKLNGAKTRFGPGSDAIYNIDLETLDKRKSVLADVAKNVKVADSLPAFDFIMSMGLPSDVPKEKLYPVVFAEMLKNSKKPIVATATTLHDIRHTHKLAAIAAGGEENLRKKPNFIAYLEPISPLRMDRTGTDRLLYCAEHGIPILYAAGANCGSGAPITPEGGVVQGSAESLAGLVLATLKNEDAKFIYGSNTSAMDMRSTIVSYGDPIWFKTVAMYADLGRFYNIPSWGTAGSSDSFKLDAQAAMEAYEGISLAVMSKTSLAHDVGYLAHGELYDPRMLVMTDMMIGRARHLLKEVDLSDEALAIEVIDEVARGEQLYISHQHTTDNFRSALWIPPKYINRAYISAKRDKLFPEMLLDEVNAIIENHTPDAVLPEKLDQIEEYIKKIY